LLLRFSECGQGFGRSSATQNADDNDHPESADRFLKFVLRENNPAATPESQGYRCGLNDFSLTNHPANFVAHMG
jgi:hypothetical protein